MKIYMKKESTWEEKLEALTENEELKENGVLVFDKNKNGDEDLLSEKDIAVGLK